MDTKLTLKLDKLIIESAKEYAKEKNISLSKMIENYLQAITNKRNKEIEISPLVKSLIGVVGQEDSNYKKDYTDYLSEKYQ
jgi:hypothetical protein